MKIKDKVLSLTLSIILAVSGLFLLLDQLNVAYIDEFFTPWYLVVVLFFVASSLAIAIIKKSPIFYVISMIFASIYLVIAIPVFYEAIGVWDIIFVVPLFMGLGLILADLICKWSVRALRLGTVIAVSSAIILVSTLLDVWTIVIPVVIILVGIAYIIFSIVDVKKKIIREQSTEHYVVPTNKQIESNTDVIDTKEDDKTANNANTTVDIEIDNNIS